MILVDSSVWIDHFRQRDEKLIQLLERGQVRCHSFIIGEIACGNLRNRDEIRFRLGKLPKVIEASHEEVMFVLDQFGLFGMGLGWIDAHLLASSLLSGARILTKDKALARAVQRIDSKL